MNNRLLILLLLSALLVSCSVSRKAGQIMTVTGLVQKSEMGATLTHEHVLVDFIGADQANETRYDRDTVFENVLPFLLEVRGLGVKTFVECTPLYLGRDPVLLKRLSEKSGLHILTNTGFYGANNNKFIPEEMKMKAAEDIAGIWIDEWKSGIGNTGVRPGFIKIGVDGGPLSEFHSRLVKAAAITHLKTGLAIASHTGAHVPAFQQMELLIESGVSPDAFIWVHANSEKDLSKLVEGAGNGAWISLDFLSEENVSDIVSIIKYLNEHNCLHKVLLSHDAGWYDPGKAGGGNFRGFTTLSRLLVPALKAAGFSQDQIDKLLIKNPANAFEIKVRRN